MLEKTIGIAIGIAIEIENNDNTNMFDPDPDSDFDPENTFEKHQSLKLMTTELNTNGELFRFTAQTIDSFDP